MRTSKTALHISNPIAVVNSIAVFSNNPAAGARAPRLALGSQAEVHDIQSQMEGGKKNFASACFTYGPALRRL